MMSPTGSPMASSSRPPSYDAVLRRTGAFGPRPSVGQPCPELAVPGVTEARHDVAPVVELAVERSAVDVHVGVRAGHRIDALGCRDQVHELDALGPPALQDLDRRRR